MQFTLTLEENEGATTSFWLGSPSPGEATPLQLGSEKKAPRFRLDRKLHVIYHQEMREGFLLETPFPFRHWESSYLDGRVTFTCEIRVLGRYRTLYGELAPTALATLQRKTSQLKTQALIHAPMTGVVIRISVEAGQAIASGDLLAVLDAMKMENPLLAKQTGKIEKVYCKPGDQVSKGSLLFSLETG